MTGEEQQYSDEICDILGAFTVADGTYKRAEVEAAIERREEITPALIRILEKTLESPNEYADDEHCILPTYALMLLGYFREPRAHTLFIDLLSLPDDLPHSVFDDLVSFEFPHSLLESCDGDLNAMRALVANRDANAYARSAAAHALAYAVAEGLAQRDEIMKFLGDIFKEWEQKDAVGDFYTFLAMHVVSLCPLEILEALNKAFRERAIITLVLNEKNVEFYVSLGVEGCISRLKNELETRERTDIHSRIQPWVSLSEVPESIDYEKYAPLLAPSLPAQAFYEPVTKVYKGGRKSAKRKLAKVARKKNRKKKR